ncbi:MAG: SGNH/GDSL hydrolase family protein [Planctomycetaceae bacterium]
MILRWALHFASGNSLFSGVLVLLVVGAITTTFTGSRRYERTSRLAVIIAVALIALSATPLPWWVYAIWAAILVVWMWAVRHVSPAELRTLTRARVAGGVLMWISVVIAGIEFRTLSAYIPIGDHKTIYVIGDSITAGLNEDDLLWPTILADTNGVDVINLAQPGAMADSAMKQAQEIPGDAGGIVLIEIGGNDLLSGRSAEAYGADLEKLLDVVSAPNRTLVMMELPLAPFKNKYGRIQRELARAYDVVLISKREFARVLGLADGTLDGIHLSEHGQRLMAAIVWQYVAPLYEMPRPEVVEK